MCIVHTLGKLFIDKPLSIIINIMKKLKNIHWGKWEILATKKRYYAQDYELDVPGCYLLGITDLRKSEIKNYELDDDDVQTVYIGESDSIMKRLNSYGETGSHKKDIIDYHLKKGFKLCFCFYETRNKKEAQEIEYLFLMKYNFEWNIKNN